MIKQTNTRYRDNFYYHANDLYIGASLELYGEYGQPEIDLLLQIINENCIVFDIGANIGYHTVAFASKAKQVVSFEPNLQNWNLFVKNTQDLENVFGLRAAVGSKLGKLRCTDFDPNQQGNFGNIIVGEEGDIDVDVVSLDALSDLPIPDLIKIDVEGMEYQVLQGMQKIFSIRRPAIYFEAHETKELPEIYDILNDLDYKMVWATIPNYNKNNFKQNKENIFDSSVLVSILAWHKSFPDIDLPPVEGREDTYKKMFARHKKN